MNAGDLYASKFAPISTLNDIEYAKLLEFAFSRNPSLKMHIYGSANFQVQPIIETINDVNVDDLYENAWLKHRNAILRGQYYFNHAEFVSNIVSTVMLDFQGHSLNFSSTYKFLTFLGYSK